MTPSPARQVPLERWWLSAALVAAPATFLSAQGVLALMPREESLFATLDAHSNVWLISHLLLVAWLVFLIPSLGALGLLLGVRGWPYRVIGGMLVAVGIVVNALILGLDFVLGGIAALNETLTNSVHQTLTTSVLAPLDQWDLALPLGLLVLSIGLYRTRSAPQWIVLLVLAGLAIPGATEIRLVAASVQLLSFTCLAVWFVRSRRELVSVGTVAPIYSRPVVGALVAVAIMVPGAFFSGERLGFAALVVVSLLGQELWERRKSGR